ncbi:PAP2 family protein [Streptacidiphilus pinicola]|uniref:PAP2 family protein n=1 Tax=Streptacidiphilus pinicola TaxID=2219663 RepID=A0A2X0ID51_9ACTN|nr:phosphatase PAP2 family protein [Streptacidiphilus pinicola]RAG82447.1 PAP2 family protein [Streptacidiphilus pinicola]
MSSAAAAPRTSLDHRRTPLAGARRPWALGLGRRGRPRWWAELLLIALCYGAYSVTRNAVPDHRAAALARAQQLLDAERRLHVSFELALNHAADHVTWLIVGMDYYYATLHFVTTVGCLVWLYVRHPHHYRAARTALYAATLAALAGFYAYALAPPRFLSGDGFIDTVVVHHTWGSWASGPVTEVSNQYAAMPSIHIAWATWCAVVLFRLARTRFVRLAALLYPVATCVVILATGNHFEADAVAGLLTIGAGFALQRALTGRPALPRTRRPAPATSQDKSQVDWSAR